MNGGEPTKLPPGVTLQRRLAGHRGRVWRATFDSRGETLASGSADNTVKLWETRSGMLVRTLGHRDKVFGVAELLGDASLLV